LLRGAVAIEGIDIIRQLRSRKSTPADKQLLNGPAKLTQGLAIDLSFNNYDLCACSQNQDAPLAMLPPLTGERKPNIVQTPRIGISQATHLPWRFLAVP
jgi:DNA-3-methyladenine glycosylase